jgi:hypothetical protein
MHGHHHGSGATVPCHTLHNGYSTAQSQPETADFRGANSTQQAGTFQCGDRFFGENATSVGSTVAVGTNPQGVATENANVWITNTGSNTVTKLSAFIGSGIQATVNVGANPVGILFDYSSMWVANTGTNSLSKIAVESNAVTTVTLPVNVQPAKMCFNGTHILLQPVNGQPLRIDIYTGTILQVPYFWSFGGTPAVVGAIAFDGLSTWSVNFGMLFEAMI